MPPQNGEKYASLVYVHTYPHNIDGLNSMLVVSSDIIITILLLLLASPCRLQEMGQLGHNKW
jgi:hypothetical protein